MSHLRMSHDLSIHTCHRTSCGLCTYGIVISHIRMSDITHTNMSALIHSYVPQDQLRALHIWMSHVTHKNHVTSGAAHVDESCHTQKSCHCGRCTYGWVMSHTKIMSHVRTIHYSFMCVSFTCVTGPAAGATHMDESWHTHESCHAYKWFIILSHVPQDQLRALHKFSEPWLTKSKVAVCCKETHMCGKAIHICGKRDPDMWRSDVRMWQKKRTWQYAANVYVCVSPYVAICGKVTHICGKATHICGKRAPDMWQRDVQMWQMSVYYVAICDKWVHMTRMWQYVANEYLCGSHDPTSRYVAKETHVWQKRRIYVSERPVYIANEKFICSKGDLHMWLTKSKLFPNSRFSWRKDQHIWQKRSVFVSLPYI